MTITRRTLIGTSAAALAAPALAQSSSKKILRFIPQADLTVLDPMWTTAYVTRNHGFLVFDTLFGLDSSYKASPQMLAGSVSDDGGKLWKLGLRSGLKFHDGTPVLAKDCVASIKRWAKRDAFGQTLMAATDELSAPDDKTIQFRLSKPFPLLPTALGKTQPYVCFVMPERLANTDAATQITEMVGSGPFRFKADERIAGAKAVYEKFTDYVPRDSGKPDFTAGPKVANVDRVEWTTIPDPATAAQALINNEQDWWDYATADLMDLLKGSHGVNVVVQEPTGQMAQMRFNFLNPPFNNPAIRHALLGAVNQADFMTAVVGTDPKMFHTPAGFFAPGTPSSSDVGFDLLTGPRDMAKVQAELKAAGYKGEKVVLLVATDFPVLKAMGDVAADMLKRAGLNVDYVATDWGTVVTRRAKKAPVDQGGWSAFCTAWAGADQANPAGHLSLRANGDNAWFGWPDDPKLEALRNAWFAAPDPDAQAKICREMQQEAFDFVPYLPLGQYLQPTAYRSSLEGVLTGFALFWNVRKGG